MLSSLSLNVYKLCSKGYKKYLKIGLCFPADHFTDRLRVLNNFVY